MTRLLVSVRNAAEARVAVDAGADLIDVKEPDRGSLGAADLPTLREVCRAVAGRRPCSAALGELLDLSFSPDELPPGFSYAKLGLAGCAGRTGWQSEWAAALATFPADVQSVAVVYADWEAAAAPNPEAVLDAAAEQGCAALLIDTYQKRGLGLFDLLPAGHLTPLLARARSHGMLTVLAGSLTPESIPAALSLSPDFVAVRGAACAGDRRSAISAHRVNALARIFHQVPSAQN